MVYFRVNFGANEIWRQQNLNEFRIFFCNWFECFFSVFCGKSNKFSVIMNFRFVQKKKKKTEKFDEIFCV